MGVVVAERHLDLHELRAIELMLPAAPGIAEALDRFSTDASYGSLRVARYFIPA
ncbi:hypothetical protein [Sorangium sp. So ce1024]|uniref:hypothetical protein n=1 Tax=Sorangium sp. So ce1024 TaxID=3133327 RepID=UPI003F05B9B6